MQCTSRVESSCVAAGSADALAVTARLIPEHVPAIQQEEPALEIRLAGDGRPYTRIMFTEWYGNAAERRWADAAALPLPSDWLAAGTTTGDAAQLSGSITRAPILEI